MIKFPEIVCLCGSTKFKDEYIAENRRLTLEGKIVLTVGLFGHHEPDFCWTDGVKAMLNELHINKIALSSRVHVIDVGGYIGKSTRAEIVYAGALNRTITYYSNNKGGA